MSIEFLNKHDAKKETRKIIDFVRMYRKKHGITPTPGYKSELSCIAVGEGRNLLFRQLILTVEGDAAWLSLEDPQIRKIVLDEIAAENRETQKDAS